MRLKCVVCQNTFDAGSIYKDYDGWEGGRCLCHGCHAKQPTVPESFRRTWPDAENVVTDPLPIQEQPGYEG